MVARDKSLRILLFEWYRNLFYFVTYHLRFKNLFTVRTGSVILIFVIALKNREISKAVISGHALLAIYIYILRIYEDITKNRV